MLVKKLYSELKKYPWIDPWIDEENLLPGQDWGLEIEKAMKKSEEIYADYKQHLVSALNYVPISTRIEGRDYLIINAKNEIKDTIIGTVASILSYSPEYEEGTIIIAMSRYENKIKVSARNVGKIGRNVREILNNIVEEIGGEVGGHKFAAGCNIFQEKEKEFLDLLKKNLEIELVKV